MKKQILEVQNYFINKITACDFELLELDIKNSNWAHFTVKIDDFNLSFGINPILKLYCSFDSNFRVEVPHDRLENLIELIEKHREKNKAEKIEKLKQELANLES